MLVWFGVWADAGLLFELVGDVLCANATGASTRLAANNNCGETIFFDKIVAIQHSPKYRLQTYMQLTLTYRR